MKKLFLLLLIVVMLLGTTGYTYSTSTMENGTKVIRTGAQSERIIQGDVVTDDIIASDFREIVTRDGDDTIRYYSDYTTGIATLSINDTIIEKYDMNLIRENIDVWVMPENDQRLLEEYFQQGEEMSEEYGIPKGLSQNYTYIYNNGMRVLVPSQYAGILRASGTVARPYESVTDAYPTYMNKTVKSATRYSSVCGRNLNLQVQDSMYNYWLYTAESEQFNAGTLVSYIADVFKIPFSLAENSLSGVSDGSGLLSKLTQKVTYYFKEDYNFSALRRTCVYDYITRNTFVSVYALDGSGRLSLTWDFINAQYTNPQWKITAQAYPHTVSFENMLSEGQRIWDSNIEADGYWKWG